MRTIEVTQSGATFRMVVEAVKFVEECPYVGRDGEHVFVTEDHRQKFCCPTHGAMFHRALRPLVPAQSAHPPTFSATSLRR